MEDITSNTVAGERRLTMLLMGHWQETRMDRPNPLPGDFLASLPKGLLIDCAKYKPGESSGTGELTEIGEKLGRTSGVTETAISRADTPPDSLLDAICDRLGDAIEEGWPILDEGEVGFGDSGSILYRAIYIPLIDANNRIVEVFVGARCKVIEGQSQ